MDTDTIDKILADHELMLRGKGGDQADFSYQEICGFDFSSKDLTGASFRSARIINCKFNGAILAQTDFSYASINGCQFDHADCGYGDFSHSYINDTSFKGASLVSGVFFGAIIDVDFENANLWLSRFQCADLSSTKNFPPEKAAELLVPPEKGSFTAFKKCRDEYIVELFIPGRAKRSSATNRKCRASEAVVKRIERKGVKIEETYSIWDPDFVYRVGETVKPHKWEKNRWIECGGGIHFFMTRSEAENYKQR